jgi:predicted HicB family RNase H-like nuclease
MGCKFMAKRKKTDFVQFKVRFRERLRAWLEAAAKAEKRSLNSEIVLRLEQSFELPEGLRHKLEKEAASRGHSMNTEISRRLSESFFVQQDHTRTKEIAERLLDALDDAIVNEMVDTVNRQRAEEDYADSLRDDPDYRENLK